MADFMRVVGPDGQTGKVPLGTELPDGWFVATEFTMPGHLSPSPAHEIGGDVGARETATPIESAASGWNKGFWGSLAPYLAAGAGATAGGTGLGPRLPPADQPTFDELEKAAHQYQLATRQDNPKAFLGAEGAGLTASLYGGGTSGNAVRGAVRKGLERKIAPKIGPRIVADLPNLARLPKSEQGKALVDLTRKLTDKALGAKQAAKDALPAVGNLAGYGAGSATGHPWIGMHLGGRLAGGGKGLSSSLRNFDRAWESPAVRNQFSKLLPAAGAAFSGGAEAPSYVIDLIRFLESQQNDSGQSGSAP